MIQAAHIIDFGGALPPPQQATSKRENNVVIEVDDDDDIIMMVSIVLISFKTHKDTSDDVLYYMHCTSTSSAILR